MPASMYAAMSTRAMTPRTATQVGTVMAKRRTQITRASENMRTLRSVYGATVRLRCLLRMQVRYRRLTARQGQSGVPRKASISTRKLHANVVEKEQNTQIEIASIGPIEC